MIYKKSKENTDTISYIKWNTSHFKVKWVHDVQVNFDILGLCCLSSFGVLTFISQICGGGLDEYLHDYINIGI